MNWIEVLQPKMNGTLDNRIYGVVNGKVTAVGKNENAGAVKLSFPWLMDETNNESNWARVAVPFAGHNRGAWFIPQVDDEVLVAFLHGDINKPVVIGCLWNGKDRPPENVAPDTILIQDKHGSYIRIDEKGIAIQSKKIHLNPES